MKTIRHYVNKIYLLGIIFLFPAFTLTACDKVTTPDPSENPVLLTAEAQTKTITVENCFSMDREKLTDKTPHGDDGLIIENDWVRMTLISTEAPFRKTLQIDVKENISTEPRSYQLTLTSGTDNTDLIITQAGKTNVL